MKTKINYALLIAGFGVLLSSCGETSEGSESVNSEQTETVNNPPENEFGLTLNEGEKWEANAETTDGVRNMKNIVEAYISGEKTPLTQCGDDLQAELDGIFDNCSMKGEAHDQLHSFLMPLIDMKNEIKGAEPTQDQLKEINEHLDLYFAFFE